MGKFPAKNIIASVSWIALMVFPAGSIYASGSAIMNVSATIVSKSTCSFKTNAANLAFGALDPLSPADRSASATAIFTCRGSAPTVVYLITQNSGLYNTGPGMNRMRHATTPTAYLPYSLALTPASGSFPRETPPQDHTVTVTGTVRGMDYQAALAGNYADTVTLTINP
jgi:spore coat protein U-like protein